MKASSRIPIENCNGQEYPNRFQHIVVKVFKPLCVLSSLAFVIYGDVMDDGRDTSARMVRRVDSSCSFFVICTGINDLPVNERSLEFASMVPTLLPTTSIISL
jgi:hypothetical protein